MHILICSWEVHPHTQWEDLGLERKCWSSFLTSFNKKPYLGLEKLSLKWATLSARKPSLYLPPDIKFPRPLRPPPTRLAKISYGIDCGLCNITRCCVTCFWHITFGYFIHHASNGSHVTSFSRIAALTTWYYVRYYRPHFDTCNTIRKLPNWCLCRFEVATGGISIFSFIL